MFMTVLYAVVLQAKVWSSGSDKLLTFKYHDPLEHLNLEVLIAEPLGL
jgi:hypothetical protein